jgi:hypothetical protein
MNIDQSMPGNDRSKIAARLVELSNQVLSKKNNRTHIALKVKNRVAVLVSHSDRVQFIISSTDLLERVKAEKFNLKPAPKYIPMHEVKHYFEGLGLNQIQAHELLFKEIVNESVAAVSDRRPKGIK